MGPTVISERRNHKTLVPAVQTGRISSFGCKLLTLGESMSAQSVRIFKTPTSMSPYSRVPISNGVIENNMPIRQYLVQLNFSAGQIRISSGLDVHVAHPQ